MGDLPGYYNHSNHLPFVPLQFQKSYKMLSTARSVEPTTNEEILNFGLVATIVGVGGITSV